MDNDGPAAQPLVAQTLLPMVYLRPASAPSALVEPVWWGVLGRARDSLGPSCAILGQ
jgi:hypothetical protein